MAAAHGGLVLVCEDRSGKHLGEIPGTRRNVAMSDDVCARAGSGLGPAWPARIRSVVEAARRVRCRDR